MVPDLSRHLDGWKQLLDEYAPETYDNPRVLCTTIMGLIPDELEEEEISLNHETMDTFQEVMEFCKKRTNLLRARSLASLKRKTGRPITSIQSQMGAGDEDDDNRVPTIAEMKEMMSAVTAPRPPRTRSTKPENMTNPDGTPKFWFHEDHCWYCDAKGHDRQSCDKYKKLLAANGGV